MFDLELFRKLNEGKDFIYSPYSIRNVFSYVYSLSDGETRGELERIFNFNSKPCSYYLNYNKELNSDSNINVANRLYLNEDANIDTSLFENLDLESINLNDKEKAVKYINDFIAKNTNNKIIDLLTEDSISDGTLFVIVNAIYLSKSWEFKPNRILWREHIMKEAFSGDLSVKNVKEHGDIDILRIPYDRYSGEHQYSMYIFCDSAKSKSEKVMDFINTVDDRTFYSLLNFKDYKGLPDYDEVYFVVPNFEFKFKESLKKYLQLLGLNFVFESSKNPLSKLSEDLCIDNVVHGAYIKTDSEGTKVAAATSTAGLFYACMKIEKDVVADSPFVFVIKDDTYNEILFMGSVCE